MLLVSCPAVTKSFQLFPVNIKLISGKINLIAIDALLRQPNIPSKTMTTNLDAAIYSLKAAVAAVLAFICFDQFHLPGAIWAPVSAVIVTQAKLHPSWQASLLRVAANLIGAFVGAGSRALLGHGIWSLGIGVFVSGLVCQQSKLKDAFRPALAATVIVILSTEPRIWSGSLDRVLGVMTGCVVALIVGFAFDRVSRLFFHQPNVSPVRQGGE